MAADCWIFLKILLGRVDDNIFDTFRFQNESLNRFQNSPAKCGRRLPEKGISSKRIRVDIYKIIPVAYKQNTRKNTQ